MDQDHRMIFSVFLGIEICIDAIFDSSIELFFLVR